MKMIDADELFKSFESEENPEDSLWTLYGIKRKIEDAPTQEQKWIPVSERLPDIDEEVLVDDGIDRFVAWWVNDGFEEGWHSFDGSYNPDKPILAWMPLPEPYKAESEEA